MKKILTIAVALICAASLFAAPKAKKTKKSKKGADTIKIGIINNPPSE